MSDYDSCLAHETPEVAAAIEALVEQAGTHDADWNVLHEAGVMIAAAQDEAQKWKDRADKYKWQVRDTCTRAEKAEAEARELRAELARVREGRNRYLHAARCAYGLLWQELVSSARVREARKLLLEALPDEERKCGIQYAQQQAGLTEAEIVAIALSQPADCGNCHEGTTEFDHLCPACNGNGAAPAVIPAQAELPLMARRKWMPAAATGIDMDVNGLFWLDRVGFLTWADWPLLGVAPQRRFRIASHDEHGLPVVPREPGVPEGAKYMRITPRVDQQRYSRTKPIKGGRVRIEDFNEHAQRGQEGQGDA